MTLEGATPITCPFYGVRLEALPLGALRRGDVVVFKSRGPISEDHRAQFAEHVMPYLERFGVGAVFIDGSVADVALAEVDA